MKKTILFSLFAVLLLVSCDLDIKAIKPIEIDFNDNNHLIIMSQNMMVDNYHSSPQRVLRFFELLKLSKPDIIGIQECNAKMKKCFKAGLLNKYDMVGISRNRVESSDGEWNVILFRKDRFDMLDHGDFWLSETPNRLSKLPDSEYYRICTWALLYDKKTDTNILMCNTHLDDVIPLERQALQLKVILDFIAEQPDDIPVFVTGDFNAWLNTPTMTLAKQSMSVSCETAAVNSSEVTGTYHAFGTTSSLIDYCLYKESFAEALEYHVWNNTFDGYISDHYAITTEFRLK